MKRLASCFFIGQGPLLDLCVELAARRGHRICAVTNVADQVRAKSAVRYDPISSDSQLKINGVLPKNRFGEPKEAFDCLFSISNPWILPTALLERSDRLAANFHPGLLPNYGGTHPISWSILKGESQHSVVWHEMEHTVDTGAVLNEASFSLEPNDTAQSVAANCVDVGVKLFEVLLKQLETGTLSAKPQDKKGRTYYGLGLKPCPGCVIDWCSTAKDIVALSRALNYGVLDNTFGTAKFLIGDNCVLVEKIEHVGKTKNHLPGMISDIGENSLEVACKNGAVELGGLKHLSGEHVSVRKLMDKLGLSTGDCLPVGLDDETAQFLTELDKTVPHNEEFWLRFHASLSLFVHPFETRDEVTPADTETSYSIPMPTKLLQECEAQDTGLTAADIFLTIVSIYFTHLARPNEVDLSYRSSTRQEAARASKGIIAPCIPLRVSLPFEITGIEAICEMRDRRVEVDKAGHQYADIRVRRALLRTAETDFSDLKYEVWSEITPDAASMPSAKSMRFILPNHSNTLGVVIFNRMVFCDKKIKRITGHLCNLAQSLADNLSSFVGDLAMMSSNEQEKLLQKWVGTTPSFSTLSISDRIGEQCARVPDAVALIDERQTLTYATLNRRVNVLARQLIDRGFEPGDVLGIYIARSSDFAIAILAALKTRVVIVPLDPELPAPRLQRIVDASNPRAILTCSRTCAAPKPEITGANFFSFDSPGKIVGQSSVREPYAGKLQDGPAYILFTSGSTGTPKGVVIEQSALSARLEAMASTYDITSSDRLLYKSSVGVDNTVWEVLAPLLRGASIVIAERGREGDAEYLISLIDQHQITFAHFVPSMLSIFLDFADRKQCQSLRIVLCGGEPLPTTLSERFKGVLDTALFMQYGLTETCIGVGFTRCEKKPDAGLMPIVSSYEGVRLYVLNERFHPVDFDVPGEICIAGTGLAKGYLNDPVLSEERFRIVRLPGGKIERIHVSGDWGKRRFDGKIDIIGRRDNQIKVRGFRVDLGEIEAALHLIPGIMEAAAVPVERQSRVSVGAYVVASKSITEQSVLRALQLQLPAYMVPKFIVKLNELPKLPNGKLSRRLLSSMKPPQSIVNDQATNLTEEQEVLAAIWRKILDIDQIGAGDNFINLGGDSLSVARMVSHVRLTFGVVLSIAAVFDKPNLADTIEIIRALVIEDLLSAS